LGCLLWFGAGGGDAGCGDDRPDTARTFYEGEVDQGDCPRSQDIAQYGAQGAALGRDGIFLREGDPAATQARALASRDRSDADAKRRNTARERLTLIRLFEELRALGYDGGYDAVRRYAKTWTREHASQTASAYIPLSFAPGEAYQFDWSHEIVVLDGATVTLKVAHVRLCHSRMMFARAYPRETQEMVFDAHDRAFAFFKGACTRGIYDNMKTAVETILVGKDRQ